MMKMTVKVSGLKELDAALGELPKAVARNTLRRVGIKAMTPVADDYRNGVAVESGHLRDSITVGTRLTKRQAAGRRREGKAFVEVYAGAGPDPAAHLEEFGSVHNAPNGALRRAWDSDKDGVLKTVADELGDEIVKSAKRVARKTARLRAKSGG